MMIFIITPLYCNFNCIAVLLIFDELNLLLLLLLLIVTLLSLLTLSKLPEQAKGLWRSFVTM